MLLVSQICYLLIFNSVTWRAAYCEAGFAWMRVNFLFFFFFCTANFHLDSRKPGLKKISSGDVEGGSETHDITEQHPCECHPEAHPRPVPVGSEWHRMPSCHCLGPEPLWVKLVGIWVVLLIVMDSNDGNVDFSALERMIWLYGIWRDLPLKCS